MSKGNEFFNNMNKILGENLGFQFEMFLYRVADASLPDYNGGNWGSQRLPNGTVALVAPDSSNMVEGGKLRLVGPMNHCDVRTDVNSAGVALTICAVNWFWHELVNKKLCDKTMHNNLQRLYDRLRDGAFSDKNNTLDTSAIFSYID